ncbi:MAG: DUF4430 domain-containing protein [Candidatus Levybacteria bacterium]|nr:DUF4430 domain-containing protein [Candidatus Levybacteria bacterium]
MKEITKKIIFPLFFALVALISLSLFFFPASTKQNIQKAVKAKVTNIPSPNIDKKIIPTILPTHAEITDEEEETKIIQITIVVTPTPSSQQSTQEEKATLSVSVDGGASFTLQMDKGKNQCDVLQRALDEKKISQLLMKYDSSLNAYGVYQINNLGKENAVWWAYTVNGKSPGQGCNHIAANNGDSVAWMYVGSR